MSVAEIFLMTWAVLATVIAVFLQSVVKKAIAHHKAIAFLLAEVASGEVEVKETREGYLTVENDDLKMTFKRVDGENHGR